MREKQRLTVEKIESNIQELNRMTDQFFEEALFCLENIESLEGHAEVIVKAIKYIDNVHALPPLKGNIEWFRHTLTAIAEIARPNSRLKKSNVAFLTDLEHGIKDYRDNALDDEELTFGSD